MERKKAPQDQVCQHEIVIVIGAGIIGLSIAWRLRQRGVEVTVLDRSRAAGEASWAAAGMLAPGGEFESGATARFAIESLRMYPEFVRELKEVTDCPIDYRVCGTLEIDSHADPELQSQTGIRSYRLDQSEAIKIAPGMAPVEGTLRFYPDDALVDPRETCRALLSACRAQGVNIVENCEVRSISIHHRVELETSQGTFAGDRAALAAGAWSGGVPLCVRGAQCLLPGTYPVRGVLVGRRFPARTLGPFIRRGHSYVAQRGSGFAIAGTSAERAGFDRTISMETAAGIVVDVERLWPEFAKGTETEAWLGFRPASDSGQPHIGRFEDTPLWLAYGHFRNGILMAPATAAKISMEMTA